jgi:hypothetical protein
MDGSGLYRGFHCELTRSPVHGISDIPIVDIPISCSRRDFHLGFPRRLILHAILDRSNGCWVLHSRSDGPDPSFLCTPPALSWTWEIRRSRLYRLIRRPIFLLLSFGTFLLRLGRISKFLKGLNLCYVSSASSTI